MFKQIPEDRANVNVSENTYDPYILSVKLTNCLSIIESKSDLQILLSKRILYFWLFVSRTSLLGHLLVQFEGPVKDRMANSVDPFMIFQRRIYPGSTRVKISAPKKLGPLLLQY